MFAFWLEIVGGGGTEDPTIVRPSQSGEYGRERPVASENYHVRTCLPSAPWTNLLSRSPSNSRSVPFRRCTGRRKNVGQCHKVKSYLQTGILLLSATAATVPTAKVTHEASVRTTFLLSIVSATVSPAPSSSAVPLKLCFHSSSSVSARS